MITKGKAMTAEQTLHQKFSALQEVLEDIGAGSKTWDDFWPVFGDVRTFLGRVDDSLWTMARMTLERAERAAREQRLEQARSAVTQARAQIGWKQ